MGKRLRAAGAALLAIALTAAAACAEPRPAVVELFTSQGCSSCPPADALLGELARRGDVIALGFHIGYWDDLGWKDPFSREASTERQKAYARHFGGQVYTPQMVVDGTEEFIGSHRDAVLAALPRAGLPAIAPVVFAGDGRAATIGGGAGRGKVLLARFVRQRATPVAAGENARRTLNDTNAVTELTVLGEWSGAPLTFPIAPPAPGEGLAILVQAADGKMLGAATTNYQ